MNDQLKPGWIPEGWEKGEPIHLFKGLQQFTFNRMMGGPYTLQDENANPVNEVAYNFPNWRLPEFYAWLEWWNDE